jgi:hypothetical protein
MSTEYTECPSFSVSYNIMGIATVTYSIIHSSPSCTSIKNSISAGGQTFSGYVTSISTNRMVGTGWYETSVTLIATTN